MQSQQHLVLYAKQNKKIVFHLERISVIFTILNILNNNIDTTGLQKPNNKFENI